MNQMTKQNLNNIKDRFERETGASLQKERSGFPRGRVLLLAVLAAAGLLLTAFSLPLFSPLDGDALSLEGTYLGNGIVSVRVENGSDKVLTFTDARLFSWNDGEVTMVPGGKVTLKDTRVEPHGEGIMTVDLSGAYDISYLEMTTPGKPKQSWYYLLLTNQSFLFGHDWMCSFSFGEEAAALETQPVPAAGGKAQNLEKVEEELRFYFEQSYLDVVPAFNEQHFAYQQKVEELLMRTPGTHVRPVDPMLFPEIREGDRLFDPSVPEDEQTLPVSMRYSSLDAARRMVGSRFSGVTSDFALQIGGTLPVDTETGETSIPLVFFAVYETRAVMEVNAYTFLYGRILPFEDLEPVKVYEGEGYTVYDVTDLFYTDLDAYMNDLLGEKVDDGVYKRLQAIRDYFRNPENLTFCFYGIQE